MVTQDLSQLKMKNDFVSKLRDYMGINFGPGSIIGDSDTVAERKEFSGGVSFSARRRREDEPKDYIGIEFWKDMMKGLVNYMPKDDYLKDFAYKEVKDFAESEGMEVEYEQEDDLKVRIGNREYTILVHVDGGYAGPIKIGVHDFSFVTDVAE